MPRAYAEVRSNGLAIDRNIQAAVDGFLALGYEITPFTREDIEAEKYWRVADKNPFVGSIKTMALHFEKMERVPERIDYPRALKSYLRRTVEQMPLEEALRLDEEVFIKPVETKLFDGAIYDGCEERRAYFGDYENCRVWVSELIPDIVAEWRCYVYRGQLVQASCYSGGFLGAPDWRVMQKMVQVWKPAPIAYTLDAVVTEEDETVLLEVNDFWAISSYGLDSVIYAEMLRDRYFEIVK